ncbi:MAG: isoleucine--tRNA ligase [Anaerolineaceae bacterium]|nr:isoleucine--tRNA ligase [Anaerolineaceae bacterium]
MRFQPVKSKLDVGKLELEILKFWQDNAIFDRSVKSREGNQTYVFYEGPPTANGMPGSHHVLSRAFKDIYPRYRAMRGYYVLRRGGWDTHGLPVEIEVEKQLGITGKEQIESYGIAEFNTRCRQSAFEYIQEWEKLTDRIGFWVDLESAYVTFENDYIESVWWILKELWKKELIYQGFKVVPYCARCGTALSDHELSLGYQENTADPSVYVKFPLKDDPNTSLLIWTTTPWTLPGNVAVAVNPDIVYVTVQLEEGERIIVAKELCQDVLNELNSFHIVDEIKGSELQGLQYEAPYNFMPFEEKAHYVVLADFVTTGEGTGIVHMAAAFGADDMAMSIKYGLPVLMTVGEDGCFVDSITPWASMWVKDADPLITDDLLKRELLLKSDTYLHTYPFCWRCDTPLLYMARSTWYIATTKHKDRLVELNQTINWYPSHIRDGRFGNWLENNVDWALGRERYWGTPLPIWIDEDGDWLLVGSVQELSALANRDCSDLDLHRPYVDDITFLNPKTGKTMHRVPEVIDVWFDSGAMPLAQWHYPFENNNQFQEQFPADYICEAVDQTRGWFYSLHSISTMLFDSVAFKNVACLGLILDESGQKMSKSKGNIVDPWDVLNLHGADAFRWYLYTASPPGQERRFSVDLVGDVLRSFTLTLWNTYVFFVTYANLDDWSPGVSDEESNNAISELDKWILSELHHLVKDVTDALENYDATGATRPIERFVDLLSNWYVRLSRRRFWKTEDDSDKHAAYATLYQCLLTVSKILAPSMPFISDAIYRNLTEYEVLAPESVHLADWPEYDPGLINEDLNREMRLVQKLVSLGHSARQSAQLKVRQPLAEVVFWAGSHMKGELLERYSRLILDELNVKHVRWLDSADEAVVYTLHPLPKQLGQKYASLFPKIKEAIHEVDTAIAANRLLDGESIVIDVESDKIEILPEEIEVRVESKEGFATAEDGGLVVGLVTDLTPELVLEGLAREVVRRVQDLRKSSGFDISDRISITYTGTSKLVDAIEQHRDYIMGEALALSLVCHKDVKGVVEKIGDETLTLKLDKDK